VTDYSLQDLVVNWVVTYSKQEYQRTGTGNVVSPTDAIIAYTGSEDIWYSDTQKVYRTSDQLTADQKASGNWRKVILQIVNPNDIIIAKNLIAKYLGPTEKDKPKSLSVPVVIPPSNEPPANPNKGQVGGVGIWTVTKIDGVDVSQDVEEIRTSEPNKNSTEGSEKAAFELVLCNTNQKYSGVFTPDKSYIIVTYIVDKNVVDSGKLKIVHTEYPGFYGVLSAIYLNDSICKLDFEDSGAKLAASPNKDYSFPSDMPLVERIQRVVDDSNLAYNVSDGTSSSLTIIDETHGVKLPVPEYHNSAQSSDEIIASICDIQGIDYFVPSDEPMKLKLVDYDYTNGLSMLDPYVIEPWDNYTVKGAANQVDVSGSSIYTPGSTEESVPSSQTPMQFSDDPESISDYGIIPAKNYRNPVINTDNYLKGKSDNLIKYYAQNIDSNMKPKVLGIVPPHRSIIMYTIPGLGREEGGSYGVMGVVNEKVIEYNTAGLIANITATRYSQQPAAPAPEEGVKPPKPTEPIAPTATGVVTYNKQNYSMERNSDGTWHYVIDDGSGVNPPYEAPENWIPESIQPTLNDMRNSLESTYQSQYATYQQQMNSWRSRYG